MSPASSLDVVVSHYEFKDFEQLRPLLPEAKFRIYDKSGKYENECVRIPNVGREGFTYLSHIIDNYDNLAPRTLFIQDDVLNHQPYLFAFAQDVILCDKDFHQFPCTWGGNGPIYRRTIADGMCDLFTLGRPDAIKIACEELSIKLPQVYTTETCAFFIATRDRILLKNKGFYEKVRDWSLRAISHEFVLEHMWALIL